MDMKQRLTYVLIRVGFPFVVCYLIGGESADPAWTEWRGSLYSMVSIQTGELGHDQAVEACREVVAYLAVPSSQAENDFMLDLYKASNPNAGMWFGCEQNNQGSWTCTEGEGSGIDTGYRNWSPSQLNKIGEPGRCALIQTPTGTDADGEWRAPYCDSADRLFMCEKAIPIPENVNASDTSAADGQSQSPLVSELLRAVESKHLSRVTMDGQSRYRVKGDSVVEKGDYKMSLLSTDVKADGMNVVSRDFAVRYIDWRNGPP